MITYGLPSQQPLLNSPTSNFDDSFSKIILPGHCCPSRRFLMSRVERTSYFLLDEVLPIGVPNAVKVTALIASTSASSPSSCLGSFASASTHPCTVGIAALRTCAACSFISWGCFPATAVLGQHMTQTGHLDRRQPSHTSCLCIGSDQALCGGGCGFLNLFDGGHCVRREQDWIEELVGRRDRCCFRRALDGRVSQG